MLHRHRKKNGKEAALSGDSNVRRGLSTAAQPLSESACPRNGLCNFCACGRGAVGLLGSVGRARLVCCWLLLVIAGLAPGAGVCRVTFGVKGHAGKCFCQQDLHAGMLRTFPAKVLLRKERITTCPKRTPAAFILG